MLTTLNNFDPVAFLDLDSSSMSQEEVSDLRTSLNAKIGEYVLLKFSQNLHPEQLEQVLQHSNGQAAVETLRRVIPNTDQQIMEEVENFKKDYQDIKE